MHYENEDFTKQYKNDKIIKGFNMMEIKGIKCDNKNCNYENDDVKFEEYPSYINKPCPVCGSNLLTQIDYDNTRV